MNKEQLLEEVKIIQTLLGDSIAYGADPALWDAMSRLVVLMSEVIWKLPND